MEGADDDGMRLGQLGERVGPAVRLLRNELTSRIAQAYARFGLHSGASSAMALIEANPGCAQADLARELALDKSVVVVIVADLEGKGFVTRTRSPTDRRRNSLALTEEGRRVVTAMFTAAAAVEQPIEAALSAEERATLIRLVRRAHAALVEPAP